MEEEARGIETLFAQAEEAGAEALGLLFQLSPRLKDSYDERRMRLAKEDMAHHIRNFAAIAFADDNHALVDYLSWLRVLFDGFGLSEELVTLSFRCAGQAASRRLSGKDAEAFDMVVQRAVFEYGRSEPATNRYLKEGLPDNGMARTYLHALIDGRRDLAQAVVDAEVRNGSTIQSLYIGLFQPAQRELGRLWHLRKITVGQEHFATAATQYIMSNLYPRLMAESRPNGKRLVAACAEGELHELGLRMVADFMQADGWDTRFLGANLPVFSLLQEIERVRPDVVALSASLLTNVHWVTAAIEAIKKRPGPKPRVLVGGLPFIVSPELWKRVGADSTGADCAAALAAANQLARLDSQGGAA